MQIKFLYEKGDSIRFLLSGAPVAFANALRRTMIAEVPCLAIGDVMIIENSSVMYDEILSHRLGLIPIVTDLDAYVPPERCDCKSELGCNRCRAALTLESEAGDQAVMVYSRDLKSDGLAKPVTDSISILKLGPSQKIKLEAYARLGRGNEHAKWQPVSACAYKYLPKVTVDSARSSSYRKVVEVCPRGVFDLDEKGRVYVKNESDCTLCMDCVEQSPIDPSPIKVEWDQTSFIFYVESTGALPPKRIVQEAAKILAEKALELDKLLTR